MPSNGAVLLEKDSCLSVKLQCPNGVLVEWYKDGSVQETLPNGDTTVFPAKPMHTAFLRGSYIFAEFFLGYMSFQGRTHGNYFEFHAGGVTVYRNGGTTFLWSQEFPARELEGTLSDSIVCDFDDEFGESEHRDSYS